MAASAVITEWISTEIREALAESDDIDEVRGGSTITQQVAKEPVPLAGPQFRAQGAGIPLALWIDLMLPKRRVLEIYLNIAEWGPNGEFGAEAGARRAFGKSARDLSRYDAAVLAAVPAQSGHPQCAPAWPGCAAPGGTYVARGVACPGGRRLRAGKALIGTSQNTSLAAQPSSISPASNRHIALFSGVSSHGCAERKTSPSRRGMRRSADALKRPAYVEDKDPGELRRPHHIDLKTGMYKRPPGSEGEDRSLAGPSRPKASCAMFMLGFPLLLIPFAIYNIIAFLMPGVAGPARSRPYAWYRTPTGPCRPGDMPRRVGDPAAVRRDHEVDAHRYPHRRRSRAVADPVPRHAHRIPAGQAGCHRDLLLLLRGELHRCARRLCGDFALGPARPYG